MTSIGIIGCGYWGPNLLRNFYGFSDCEVCYVADQNPSRLEYIHRYYPTVPAGTDYKRILESDIEGVVIATPAASHYALAKESLLQGKHVLVEKPLALTSVEAQELVDLAKKARVRADGRPYLYL